MTLTDEQIEEIKARAERDYREWDSSGNLQRLEDMKSLISALEAEKKRADEAEDRAERFQDALQELQQWANAYPLNIFPEPNFSLAAKVLTDAGISLDAISASNMRHVLTRVEEITRVALKESSHDKG